MSYFIAKERSKLIWPSVNCAYRGAKKHKQIFYFSSENRIWVKVWTKANSGIGDESF